MSTIERFSKSFSIFVELTSIFIAIGTIASAMIHAYIFSYNGFKYLSIATVSDIFRDGLSFAVNVVGSFFISICIILSIYINIVALCKPGKRKLLIVLFSLPIAFYFILFSVFIVFSNFSDGNYEIYYQNRYVFFPEIVYIASIFVLFTCFFMKNDLILRIEKDISILCFIVFFGVAASIFGGFVDIQNRFTDGFGEDNSSSYFNRNVAGITLRGRAADVCKEKSIGGFVGSSPLFVQAELLWIGERAAIIQCKDFYENEGGISPNAFRKALIINPDQLIF